MSTYRLGSAGTEVRQIQSALQARGLYAGPLDGLFGGGTEVAVRRSQTSAKLTANGIVGPETWLMLFGAAAAAAPAATPAPKSIDERCLALTASFETGTLPPDCYAGVAGDFDGMGLSFGALQWNFGQGTLQPLLRGFDLAHGGMIDQIFNGKATELRAILASSAKDQLHWARSIQTTRFALIEPWLGYFRTLGRTPEFISTQVSAVDGIMQQARKLCATYRLGSQRAMALMFDILTQNGSIPVAVSARINQDIRALSPHLSTNDAEIARLRIVANRRSDAVQQRWREDVRMRKLTIAEGSGTVHGRFYDLASQYGLGLVRM